MTSSVADSGLRERKKQQTRKDLHRAALEIADELGVEATTVEAVAARAGVSSRTFFNYFPTKDDALLGTDPTSPERAAAAVREAPQDLSIAEVIRQLIADHVTAMREDLDLWRLRRRVTLEHPELAIRMLGSLVRIDKAIVEAAIERAQSNAGAAPIDELAIAVEVHATLGASRAAIRQYVADGMTEDLSDLLDRAYALLR